MKKVISIFAMAGVISFGLFAFMAFLINSDQVETTLGPPPVIVDIVKTPEDSKPEIKARKLLQPPEPPPVMELSKVSPEITKVNTDFSYTPTGLKMISNNTSSLAMNSQPNQDARPVVRVNPKYPINALREGIQGWVTLAFDISEIGQVINVKVLDSQPKRIFDKAAKQALRKWKYRAKSIDGKQVQQKNFTVQLDFTMEQQI
ncbi:energy transducer TonB [Colwellia sp. KU-HH00111]|uniref:energy transducer TonB n=1 Tax=Colwellia sp. KU-HH00111 TaxID=3127652 RepID=UPI00310760BB